MPHDRTEASVFLLSNHVSMQVQDARLLGPNNAHVPRLIETFVQTLGRGTDLVEEGVGLRMAGLLHSMSAPALVEAAYNTLKPQQQVNFRTYMNGQVPK